MLMVFFSLFGSNSTSSFPLSFLVLWWIIFPSDTQAKTQFWDTASRYPYQGKVLARHCFTLRVCDERTSGLKAETHTRLQIAPRAEIASRSKLEAGKQRSTRVSITLSFSTSYYCELSSINLNVPGVFSNLIVAWLVSYL